MRRCGVLRSSGAAVVSCLFALAAVAERAIGASPHFATAVEQQAQPPLEERLKRIGAELFSGKDRFKEAIAELKEVLAVEPNSAEAHLLLGVAYRGLGSPEFLGEAVAELRQALTLNPALVPARLYLAYLYRDLGRPRRAKEELDTALGQAPGHPQLLALLADTERQLGHADRALPLLDRALEADRSFAQARYYRGLALIDLKRSEEAIAELETVVQSGPPVVEAYLALGTAYLDAGRADAALNVLPRAAKLAPDRPEIQLQLARAYRLKGLLARADDLLTRALARSTVPSTTAFSQYQQLESDLYLEQGLLRMQQGRLQAAAAAFQKVLDMDAHHPAAKVHMADVQARIKKQSGAKKAPGGAA
jgi:tetratricopeptide (TPR) repeat protein